MANSTSTTDEKPKAVNAKAKGKVVKYVGTADRRVLTVKDWGDVDPDGDGHKLAVWDASNDWTVNAEDLTEGQLKYVDENDSGFVVADAEK